MKIKVTKNPFKVLYFDCETVAAGFADPDWVPNRVTCIAWSWEGEEKVHSYTRREGAELMFSKFLDVYNKSDVVIAHNILRFDLGVINSDLMRLKAEGKKLQTLSSKLVQDTIKLPKSKGFKKGLDDLSVLLGVPIEKLSMNHRQWEEAYDWDKIIEGKPPTKKDWETIKKRCESDVLLLKLVRQKLAELGMLKTPSLWSPHGR
jgi:hypothetical protein